MAYKPLEENKNVLDMCSHNKTRVCKTCPYRELHDVDNTKCYDKVMQDALEYMNQIILSKSELSADKRYFDEEGNDITTDVIVEFNRCYIKGRIEQIREDARYCQKYKDGYNEASLSGDKSKFPINIGTIMDICRHMWMRLSELEQSNK